MALEFVEDWMIVQTLGEGAYGEVVLLVNKTTDEGVAMKVIDVGGCPEAREAVKKEVAIQRALVHPHILRYYGRRQSNTTEYIFLEYAPHGELFDRIEPDVGMSQCQAQKFLKQLISGVQYLHSKGVAHRDIKPENLLLDANDNIKISDFGMATLFRVQGKERALEKRCGTLPYVAPEVLCRPYAAEPADVWSCGIVLVAMLAGELPWDVAGKESVEYKKWVKGEWVGLSPWCKLDTLALSLLRRILFHLPSARYTLGAVLDHPWTRKEFVPDHRHPPPCPGGVSEDDGEGGCYSQPANAGEPLSPVDQADCISFSQPAIPHDLLISTQQIFTQSPTAQNSLQKLVRRMTRFFTQGAPPAALEEICAILNQLNLPYKAPPSGPVTVTTVDKRKSMLIFKVNLLDMSGTTLVDFRLSKGCGLEFKRHFISIRAAMDHLIVSPPQLNVTLP